MQKQIMMKKTPKQQMVLAQLNTIYPNHEYSSVVSSASRALIASSQNRQTGLGAGRQIALTVMAFTALNLAMSEAKALDCSSEPINVASGEMATGCVIGNAGNGADNMFVSSGGSAISTTINQSGKQVIYDGATASDTVINSGGMQNIEDAGLATSSMINSGGVQNINWGGSATSTTVNTGGLQNIELGGKSTAIVQHAGGNVNVTVMGWDPDTEVSGTNESGAFSLSNGVASGFVINSGGVQNVDFDGSATSTIINAGGLQNIVFGGKSTGIVQRAGGNVNVTVGGGDIFTEVSGTNEIGAFSLSNGVASGFVINAGGVQNVDPNGLSQSTMINSGGLQQIYADGSATTTTINAGGLQDVGYGGKSMGIVQRAGGNVNVTVVGGDTDTEVSGTNESGAFSLSNGVASGFIIYAGGAQNVDLGGSASFTTVNSGGEQTIYTGGSALSTTVNSGGLQNVASGGEASASVLNGGQQYLYSGALATDAVINNGGEQMIDSGGSATNTTINAGGMQNIDSGGKSTAIVQRAGGNVNVAVIGGDADTEVSGTNESGAFSLSNGVASGFVINAGGVQNVDAGGFAASTTVNSGGLQNVSSGGEASASILNGGQQYLYSGALATNTVINNDGEQMVDFGGAATNTTVNIGGLQRVVSGGTANGTSVNGGNLIAESGALFNGALNANNGTIQGTLNNPVNLSVNLINNSLWTMYGDSTITHLALSNSTIRFDTAGAFKTLTLTGDLTGSGQFVLNTNLGDLQGDKLIFQGNTNGSHTISINNRGGEPAASGQYLEIVDVTGGGANNATFALTGDYVDAGAYRYTLEPGSGLPAGASGNWYLYNTGQASQMSRELQAVGNFTDTIMLGASNNLYKRMGELRFDNQHQGNLWARTYHKDFRNTLYEEASGTQQVSGIDIGVDKLVSNTNGRLYLGGLFSYGESDFKTSNNARFDSDHYQLGLYATWLHEGGTYIDLSSRYFWFDHDYRFSQGNADFEHASNKTEAFLLSLEAGHRFDLAQNWFIEPQAELIMTRSDSFNLTTDHNNHLSYKTGKSTLLRGGLMFGKTIRDQTNTMQVYAKLDRLEYLRASYDVSVNDSRFNSKKPDGSWMATTGVQVQHKNMQIYLEADANVGSSDIKQRWGINLGARWQF